jgi:putative heme-binding domain-containing protein
MNRWLCLIFLSLFIGIAFTVPARAAEFDPNIAAVVDLLELVIDANEDAARKCLETLAEKVRSGEVERAALGQLKERLGGPLGKIVSAAEPHPLAGEAALLAALWKEPAALADVRRAAKDVQQTPERRQAALETLAFADDPSLHKTAGEILSAANDATGQRAALAALSRADEPEVASIVLEAYPALAADHKPLAIELLTQRAVWGRALVAHIAQKKLPASALNVNQVRKLQALADEALAQEIARHWGKIRDARDPAREQLIGQMRELLAKTPGDPRRGMAVFGKLCGQCHKIHGQGQEVGPDITANGRASYDQLLSNVFDPSLVIGAAYQARSLRTLDGRVITGLLVEESPQRVVLKVQGGKLETVPRDDIEVLKVSELSLMPEGIEKQLQPQEIADLFAFITLDKHPDDPTATKIPGTSLPKR